MSEISSSPRKRAPSKRIKSTPLSEKDWVDAATEKAIIAVLQGLRDSGKTVIAVHHDLTTVPSYFDDVLILNVRKVAHGPVAEAFTQDALNAAYGGRLTMAEIEPISVSA